MTPSFLFFLQLFGKHCVLELVPSIHFHKGHFLPKAQGRVRSSLVELSSLSTQRNDGSFLDSGVNGLWGIS